MKYTLCKTVLFLSAALFLMANSMQKTSFHFLPKSTVHALSATNASYKSRIKSDIKKILSLKVNGYQELTLKEFSDYLSETYKNKHSIWKARQRTSFESVDAQRKAGKLSEDDYRFLTVTIPCTESESTYPSDRASQTPPDFARSFDIYSKSERSICHFEYCVGYSADFTKTTIGERDEVILNIIKGMENFVKETTIDPSKDEFHIKINKKLETLLKKYAVPGIELKVFQYPYK